MPPRKPLDPVFRPKETDASQVQCTVCAEGVPEERHSWIAVTSAAAHLKTSAHSQAVALARIRTQEKEAGLKKLQSEREAASATDELRMIQFTAHRPVASASSKLMSAEERDMWEDYRVNGADFSVGDDIEDQQKQRRRLQEEADVFGLWNPDATARLLGFGGEGARDQVQETKTIS
ncbi:hypothetical protein DFH08DRAFT_812008 [Mycena albidolilacea]|uniref:Uncharacterized protein n=1 Tax=Mycena albidolilacea TaxID=1033008 RepID=A0AAD6ZWC6_9AGAR|nr:hypothetical protein DFH08DRAFT_812008 [Mycena albidolilacea]